jgi:xanthine dehydrogenase large subunit
MLKQKINSINVICKRLGGGFGGKETSFLGSCITALLAQKIKKPVKLFFDRTDNMVVFGKRHPFETNWEVGFDEMGIIEGIKIDIASNAGISSDLSGAVNLRALLHLDNCYFLENILIKNYICKTNISTSTAFRGFGGPQGILVIENIIDDIARFLKKDPAEIRKRNFYQPSGRKNITHYGQKLEDANVIHDIYDELQKSSNYKTRQNNIKKFNSKNKYYKRGISFNFCKFGISFTTKFLNQGGAQVNFYLDGSVHVNTGGCEMGNSYTTKVSQVAAHQLGLPVNKIKISATNTYKVSNTSPSAASSTTDLSAMATVNAISNVKQKISAYIKSKYKLRGDVKGIYKNEKVKFKGLKEFKFKNLIQEAYLNRVQLFSSGFYKVPKINFDKKKFKGSPFYYFTWGACVSEVEVDVLTGETKILRVDAIIDAGKPINKNLEIGQAAGGLTQAFGWALHEEVIWNSNGKLLTDTLSTYKVPSINDKPEIFNVELYKKGKNRANSINFAKTLGEPPFCLGSNIIFAVKDAVHACSNYKVTPKLNLPATPEKVLMAIQKVRS